MNAPQDLILIGGGEHARVIADAARSRPDLWNVVGFVDPNPCPKTVSLGIRQFRSEHDGLANASSSHFVLGIGKIDSLLLRRELVKQYAEPGVRWATVVHASACVSPSAILGEGVVIFAGAIVNTAAVLERHCMVNSGAIVEHDVRVGEFTFVGPGATIGGGTDIGADSYLGLGCRVRDHISVGRAVMLGMGTVVVKAVPDGATMMGVPAREKGLTR